MVIYRGLSLISSRIDQNIISLETPYIMDDNFLEPILMQALKRITNLETENA